MARYSETPRQELVGSGGKASYGVSNKIRIKGVLENKKKDHLVSENCCLRSEYQQNTLNVLIVLIQRGGERLVREMPAFKPGKRSRQIGRDIAACV